MNDTRLKAKLTGEMTAESILSGLKTQTLGKKVYCYISVDSTQQIAKRLASQGAEEGTLIVAEEQIQGRGKRGHRWESLYGRGIWASLILYPQIPPFHTWKLTLAAGISISKAISLLTALHPTLKWPNDILLGGKKVGGILCERSTQPNEPKKHPLILGFGLNVNHRREDFSEGIRPLATSVYIESGREVSRTRLLQVILEIMEKQFERLSDPHQHRLFSQWRKLAAGLRGESSQAQLDKEKGLLAYEA